jgi:hypothetical protein
MPLLVKNFIHPEAVLRTIAAVPVAAIIFFAVWVAAASVYENICFSRANDQIFGLVAAARDYAGREKNFASQDGEDLLPLLVRAGSPISVTGADQSVHMTNPWHANVKLTAAPPNAIRVETDVPVRDCRRIAASIVKDAANLGLKMMEAQEGVTGAWRRFYDDKLPLADDARPIVAACGQAPEANLALIFRLR